VPCIISPITREHDTNTAPSVIQRAITPCGGPLSGWLGLSQQGQNWPQQPAQCRETRGLQGSAYHGGEENLAIDQVVAGS
jgi:hypothetical protein